jgi:hypothetical protein
MRYPAVAGTYYSSDKNELKKQVETLLADTREELKTQGNLFRNTQAIIVPHGRLSDSGSVAAAAYAALDVGPYATFVILGTDHFGRGGAVSLSRDDWITPLGTVKNDREFAELLRKESQLADFDEEAHALEPAIEVQLPFIQTIVNNPKVVEISIANQTDEVAKDLANAIMRAQKASGRTVVLIGSSDFSANDPKAEAERKDKLAVKHIEEGNPEGFIDLVDSKDLGICGPAIIAATMIYARNNQLKASVVKRGTFDIDSNVTSYIAIAFHSV